MLLPTHPPLRPRPLHCGLWSHCWPLARVCSARPLPGCLWHSASLSTCGQLRSAGSQRAPHRALSPMPLGGVLRGPELLGLPRSSASNTAPHQSPWGLTASTSAVRCSRYRRTSLRHGLLGDPYWARNFRSLAQLCHQGDRARSPTLLQQLACAAASSQNLRLPVLRPSARPRPPFGAPS